jgi:hypothetical protein
VVRDGCESRGVPRLELSLFQASPAVLKCPLDVDTWMEISQSSREILKVATATNVVMAVPGIAGEAAV